MNSKRKQSRSSVWADLETLVQLLDIGHSLIAVRDLSALLKKIVTAAGSILKADVIVLYEYREDIDDVNVPPVIWGKLKRPIVLKGRGLEHVHRDSIVFKMLKRSKPFYAPNALQDWIKAVGAKALGGGGSGGFVQREGIASSAAVRLTAEKKALGVLFINYRTPHTFSEEERKIIEIFATQAATAIQNARLFEEAKLHADKLAAMYETGDDVTSLMELDALLRLIAERSTRLTGADKSLILLVDVATEQLIKAIGSGYDRGQLEDFTFREVWDGISGWVLREGRSTISEDILTDPRNIGLALDKAREEHQRGKSIAAALLSVGDRPIGTLTVVNNVGKPAFSQDDLDLVVMLANQAAIAIENARLFTSQQSRVAQLETLHSVLMGALMSRTPEEILPKLVDTVNDILGPDASSVINLYEADQQRFHSHYASGPMKALLERVLPRNEGGISIAVVRSGQALYIDDGTTDPRRRPSDEVLPLSFACLPLRAEGRVLGTLYVRFDQKPHHFSDDEKRMLTLFADGASLVYRNAQLFEERIRTIREIGFGITAGLDLDTVLNDLLARTLKLMKEASRGEILLLDESRTILEIHAAQGDVQQQITEIPIDKGIVGRVAQSGQSYKSDDVEKEEGLFVRRLAGTRSEVAVPLKQKDRLIGVLNVEHPLESAFNVEDVKLLEAIASQVVIAIENARLFSQVTHQVDELTALYEVGTEILASLEWGHTLQMIADRVCNLADAARSLVLVFDEVTRKITAKGVGYPEEHLAHFTAEELRAGVSGWVFKHNEPKLIEDALRDEWNVGLAMESALRFNSRSLAVAPLHVKDKVIGTLTVVNTQERPLFTPQTLETVVRFADQAAIAIENARLYNELQGQAEQLVRLQEVAASVLAESKTPDKVLQLIATRIAEIFRAFSCTIRLYDPALDRFGESTASEGSAKRSTHTPRSDGTTSYLLQTKQPIFAEDAMVTLPNGQLAIRPENHAKGVEAVAYLPMLVGAELIGRLGVSWSAPRRFSENDKRLLDLFADQAAATIKMARLYNHLRAVHEVSKQLTLAVRMNEQDILVLIHEQIKPLMDTKNMYIALYDETTDTVKFPLMFVDGKPTQVESRRGGRGRTEWIIRNREPIFIETRGESSKWYEEHEGRDYLREPFASWVGVPLMAGDKVLGVIATYHKIRDYVYTKDDQNVLELMASQAAIVLQNARMWEAMQRLSEDLSAVATLDVE